MLEVFGTFQTRLPVGTNGQVLKADSSQTYGVAWSAITTGPATSALRETIDSTSTTIAAGTDAHWDLLCSSYGSNYSYVDSWTFLEVRCSHPDIWVRWYIDASTRTADSGRDIDVDPTPGDGVLLEVITDNNTYYDTVSGEYYFYITPGVFGWNSENTGANRGKFYMAVKNNNSSSQNVRVKFKIVPLEFA